MKVKKTKKRKIFIFLLLTFVLLTSIVIASLTPGLKGSLDQELRIFFKQTERILSKSINITFQNLFISLINKNKNEINYEKLKINISFKNYKELKKEREKALAGGINQSRVKVPITIDFQNKKIKASARLKGVLPDHFGYNKQYSLMIKLKEGMSINGMKEFSLTQHSSRQFPQNLIYSKILENLGLDMPNFYTFKVSLNGDDWGLMLAEEQYSDAYFELRRKKYSLITKFTNEDDSFLFRKLKKDINRNYDIEELDYLLSKHGIIENSYYNQKDFDNFYFENTFSYIDNIKFLLVKNNIIPDDVSTIFDLDKFSKIFLLSFIGGEYHSLSVRNIRFYFNPFTQKLEPIATDWGEQSVRKLYNIEQLKKELDVLINCYQNCNRPDYPFYNLIIKNRDFIKYLNENLNQVEKQLEVASSELEILCRNQIPSCKNKIDIKVISNNLLIFKKFLKDESFLLKNYYKKKYFFIENINTFKTNYLSNLENPIFIRIFDNGQINMINLTPFEISIKKIFLYKKNCQKNCVIEKKFTSILNVSDFDIIKKELDMTISEFENIYLELSVQGKDFFTRKFRIEKNYLSENKKFQLNIPKNFSVINNKIVIGSGDHIISEPLILPKNYSLEILPGAKIMFKEDSYIHLVNGNISAIGDPDKKIIFTSWGKNVKWNGILVSESNAKSLFKNVVFENLKHFEFNKVKLTGAINFYKSNVEFNKVFFLNTIAEDFLNITESNFLIKESYFNNCLSDALDSDFSNGKYRQIR